MSKLSSDNDDFSEREFKFSEEDFIFIVKLIKEKTGINIQPHKKNMVYSRIARRIRKMNFKSFQEYRNLLQSDNSEDEIVDFINALTTNLTKFFRENHHFEHLKKVSLPKAMEHNYQTKRLRIWSAGCSTGMEAYSIAMTIKETIKNINNWDIKILATDIDTNVLDTGRKGIYRKSDVETVPSEYKSKYLKNISSDQVEMHDSLKALIYFKPLNLIENWPLKGPFDIIFCRNVIIYFTKDTQKMLFSKFENVLSDSGFLYVGHSESLHNVSDRFKLIERTTYEKVK